MAHLYAVVHYTEMARQAAALRAGQNRFEQAPEDDECPTDDDCRDIAEGDVLASPGLMSRWLAAECASQRKPVDMTAITECAVIEGDVPMLLAVLLAGDDAHVSRALHRLRELAVEHNDSAIRVRHAELAELHGLEMAP